MSAEIEQALAVNMEMPPEHLDQLTRSLQQLKQNALARNSEETAKHIWVLETILAVQAGYRAAFGLLRAGEFYQAWCTLERVELDLDSLGPHMPADSDRFGIPEIADKVSKLQGLYPYRLFMSPEILIEEERCTICNAPITPRNQCEHKIGEIYGGECCARRVTKMKPLGMSFVEDPVQRYSVPFRSDQKTGQLVDHYNYSLLKYLMSKVNNPFDKWRYEISDKSLPHANFATYGRNGRCPCGSGKKYKKCCLQSGGVRQKHYEFIFGEN